MSNYILIDGSYYCFYRYYALLNWWKMAHSEEDLDTPYENKLFVEKFKTTFIDKIKELSKKLKIKDSKIIVAKDCPRKKIWRQNQINHYKETRDYSNFKGGPFFKMVFEENLFEPLNCKLIQHPYLEADDCAYYVANHYKNTHNVFIIANDHDYMQIICDKINVINLQNKNLKDNKNFYNNSKKALFMKIILGDKSDNIPPVFKKCGIKTAEKYFENEELFNNELNNNIESKNQYLINKKYLNELKNTYFNT